MKISIAISILILLIAAAVGFNDRQKLSETRLSHAKLVAEAAELGVSIELETVDGEGLMTKRAREDKEVEAKAAAKDMIAFALEMEKFKETGGQPDETMQQRITDFMDRMLSLDSSQLKILIAEFRASTEMNAETRDGMIVFAIMTLANDHPEAALSIFTESGDLVGNAMMAKHLLSSSLTTWATKDPDAALEWIRENGKKHPDLITNDVKAGLVQGAAINDMERGFDLIPELGLEKPDPALHRIAHGVKTPEERTQFLTLLRKYSKDIKDGGSDSGKSSLSSLADGIAKDGFEAGSKWMTDNKLTPGETIVLASTIGYSAQSSEKGQWIAWMGENLGKGERDQQIRSTVINWTRSDYRAAGEWLASAPEGPTKMASVKGYVAAVSKYDPQTATQWALTLPVGEERNSALNTVFQNMPKETAAGQEARESFKAQHGIK